jgi:chromosome partitioning protein
MGKIIAISNHKGGVGKTTTTVNLGAGLAKLNKKILLVDLDPQANLTQCYGITKPESTLYEVLKGEMEVKPIEINENLFVAPSSLDLAGAEMELTSEAGREYLLEEILNPIKDQFDYIFVDCPPSLGLLTLNAFTCADEVIIPIQAHFLAIKGLTKIIEVINKVKRRINKNLEISGVVITLYDKRKVLHRDIEETINTYFQEKVFKAKIRQNIALAEAPAQGEDIFRYNITSSGADDYWELCKEFLEREKNKTKKI